MFNAESLLGRVIGGVYAIERVIATGSTSVVYRGTHTRLGSPLAVKVLAGPVVTNESLMARFEAEAKVQARLNHPHIVTVYDFIAEDGIYAIAMEYVSGVGLDQIMYDLGGPMDITRVKELMLPVLEAVGFAHAHNIVHRDIKPSNILVTEVGGREYPKVMDFGIAKVAEGVAVTAPGAMVGTLLFMSPEQCKALKTVDLRADIYSLGVTLYQMATAMVPFYSESAFDIMLAHVEVAPTPPHELAPHVPADLEAIILKALAKEPADRFSSTAELAQALAKVGEMAITPRGTRLGLSAYELEPAPTLQKVPTGPVPRPTDTATRNKQQSTGPQQTLVEEKDKLRPSAEYAQTRNRSSQLNTDETRHLAYRKVGPVNSAVVRALRGFGEPNRPATATPSTPGPAGATPSSELEAVTQQSSPQGLRLRLRVPNLADWGRYYDANIPGGGIFCPMVDPPEVGTRVILEITFVGGPRFFFSGAVIWRRTQSRDSRARAGAGVQLSATQQAKIDYLIEWTRGQTQEKRGRRRLPLKFRVAYSGRTGKRVNFTRDIHEEGLFLRSRELLDVNTSIQIWLAPHDARHKPFRLEGRVARLVLETEDRGMGIELSFAQETQRREFASFVDDLERAFLAGTLPEELLS